MDELIAQIRAASANALYYLALVGALTLPDICGALQSENGRATGLKYKAWVRANVPTQAAQAEMIYGLRCSLLHQGRAMPKGSLSRLRSWHRAGRSSTTSPAWLGKTRWGG